MYLIMKCLLFWIMIIVRLLVDFMNGKKRIKVFLMFFCYRFLLNYADTLRNSSEDLWKISFEYFTYCP